MHKWKGREGGKLRSCPLPLSLPSHSLNISAILSFSLSLSFFLLFFRAHSRPAPYQAAPRSGSNSNSLYRTSSLSPISHPLSLSLSADDDLRNRVSAKQPVRVFVSNLASTVTKEVSLSLSLSRHSLSLSKLASC